MIMSFEVEGVEEVKISEVKELLSFRKELLKVLEVLNNYAEFDVKLIRFLEGSCCELEAFGKVLYIYRSKEFKDTFELRRNRETLIGFDYVTIRIDLEESYFLEFRNSNNDIVYIQKY